MLVFQSLQLISAQKLGITFFGIQLRRQDCLSGLSILGDTFEKDIHAQSAVSDCEHLQRPLRIEATGPYRVHVMLIAMNTRPDLTRIQCCVDVACQTGSEQYGYCVNDEKECYQTAPRAYVHTYTNSMHVNFDSSINMAFSGDCPTLNTKCCTKEIIVDDPFPDGSEGALAAQDQLSSNWDLFNTGSTLSFDNLDNGGDSFGLSTFGEDEQLFSSASPGIDTFDDGGQYFDFGA